MSEKKMRNNIKNSGTDFVRVQWGKDFCQFYSIKKIWWTYQSLISKHVWKIMNCAYCHIKSTESKRNPYGLSLILILFWSFGTSPGADGGRMSQEAR
jgi:hypothetical protein